MKKFSLAEKQHIVAMKRSGRKESELQLIFGIKGHSTISKWEKKLGSTGNVLDNKSSKSDQDPVPFTGEERLQLLKEKQKLLRENELLKAALKLTIEAMDNSKKKRT